MTSKHAHTLQWEEKKYQTLMKNEDGNATHQFITTTASLFRGSL
jgi:hypothetical protein